MKIKNLLKDILQGSVTVPDEVWNYAWAKGSRQNCRFPKDAYEAIRLNDEFMLVKVPKATRPADAAGAAT